MCLSHGTELGWTSPMQPLLTSANPPVGSTPLTLDTVAWLGSISHLGSVVGTLVWSFTADRFGRKLATTLTALPFILSWILILSADHVVWLLVARFISGIASCGARTNVPALLSETADDAVRGFFGSFPIMFIDVGVLVSYVSGSYLQYYGVAAVGLAVPVVFLLFFVWLPESPVFLWKAGKFVEAEESLLWYKGGDEATVEKTLQTYKLFPKSGKKSLQTLVATKGTRKAVIIALALGLALQTSGYFIIVSYAASLFETSGGDLLSPHDSAIFITFVQLVFSCLASLVVDRLGRRFLLLCSEAVMTLTLFSLGYHFFAINDQTVSADSLFRWTPIALLSLHLAAHGLKAPVAYTLKAEIFPPEIKGLALSLSALFNSLLSFTFVKMFPAARDLWQLHGCFWILSGCSLFFVVFIAVYVPETKNKPQSVILLQLNGEDLRATSEELNICNDRVNDRPLHSPTSVVV